MVPPPLVAQNRALLMQALQTNVLGQNTSVIAQLEAQYGHMWAQDSSTMFSYAAQSSTATKVTPFKEAPEVTNANGQAQQGSAVSSATSTAAGNASSTTASAITQTPKALAAAATPTATDPFSEIWFC